MANEKLAILKMLEEGKITAEEAARLMEAGEKNINFDLESKRADMSNAGTYQGGPAAGYSQNQGNTGYSANNNRQGSFNSAQQGGFSSGQSQHQSGQGFNRGYSQHTGTGQNYNGNHNYGGGVEGFATDLGRKFDTFAKDMEPKIQKFAKTVVEKTADVADSLSKTFAGAASPYAPSYKPYGGTPSNSIEKNFEIKIIPGYCELSLSGLNGDVVVNGYNGDKITAKVYYRPKMGAASIELMKLGDKYHLNYDPDEFEFVAIDAYVPESMFKNVKLDTVNGNVFTSTISSEYFTVNTIGGKTELKNIHARYIKTDGGNGDLSLFAISGENAQMEVFNGNVAATSIDVANLGLTAANGSMSMNIDYLRNFNEYTWVLDSSNGKFHMNVPFSNELGYYVKAQTSLGSAKVGISGMNYIVNNGNIVEAKSHNYDTVPKKVKIKAETSNGTLVIN